VRNAGVSDPLNRRESGNPTVLKGETVMSSRNIGRGAAACAVTAALVAAGALPAANAHEPKKDDHYGYVKVCQKVYYDHDKKDDKKDDKKFHATYNAYEGKYDYGDFTIYDDYCKQAKVKKGYVTVKVVYYSSYAKLDGPSYKTVYVDKDEYKDVWFSYKAKKHGYGHAA